MSARLDPELEELFGKDAGLLRMARNLSLASAPAVQPDPAFRSQLRRRLMQAAWAEHAERPSLWSRLFAPHRLAWAGAAVGTVLIAMVAILMYFGQAGYQVVLPPTSPLANSQTVSVVKPIELDFNQPMDHASVEKAVQVQPATPVKYDWKGNSLLITPITGTLAPNTQYQVTLAPNVATNVDRKPITETKVITFVTQPTPVPTPAITPTPSTPPALVTNEKALGPVGTLPAQWSADGATLYLVTPDGKLQALPAGGGDPKTLATGVKQFRAAADGVIVQMATGFVVLPVATGGTAQPLVAANPVALGLAQGKPVYVEGKAAHTAAGAVALADTATAGWFSPAGDRLAYQAASGFHVVDLGSGKDSTLAGATGFLSWSPDGRRLAYKQADGVYGTTDGTQAARISSLPVDAVSWSLHDELLLAAPGTLSLVNADGSGQRQLASADFGLPVWAPAGGTFAFSRGGQLYSALVPSALSGLAPTLDETLKVVDGYEKALQAGSADQAVSYLDDSARPAQPSPALRPLRYFVLVAQPGQATVRLLLGDKKETSATDETLYIQRSATGSLLIHKVTAAEPRALATGPWLISVKPASNQVQLEFDSFLDLGAGQGVLLKDANGKAVPVQAAVHDRFLVLTLPGGLETGAAYQLVLNGTVKDVKGAPLPGEETVPLLGP